MGVTSWPQATSADDQFYLLFVAGGRVKKVDRWQEELYKEQGLIHEQSGPMKQVAVEKRGSLIAGITLLSYVLTG